MSKPSATPPPPGAATTVQVHCVSWKTMDFRLKANAENYRVCDMAKVIRARHGDPIENLVLYRNSPEPGHELDPASKLAMAAVGSDKIYYDFYPPYDPFLNRPTAGEVRGVNQLVSIATAAGEKPHISTKKLRWSKTAEHDPWTVRELAAEAAKKKAAEEAEASAIAKAKAEREAAARARMEAKEARRLAKAEAEAKAAFAKEQAEKKARAEAEEAERQRIAELAANDPAAAEAAAAEAEAKAAAEAAEAAAAAAEEALAALPKRAKGKALGMFFGPTTKTYFGFDALTEEAPWKVVACEAILAEIQDKGKISDMYVIKEAITKYDGEDKEMLFCLDKEEAYGDNGMVVALSDVEKQWFIASIGAGKGLPPEIK